MGLAHRSSLVSPRQSFSLSLSLLFFRLIPWNMEAPCVHLSAQVSKTWTGRRSASSLPWGTGKAPVASVNRANFLSRSFIGFICKPRNISLFLSSIFLSTIFFPYLSLNQLLMPFFLQVPLDPAGAGPRQFSFKYLLNFAMIYVISCKTSPSQSYIKSHPCCLLKQLIIIAKHPIWGKFFFTGRVICLYKLFCYWVA